MPISNVTGNPASYPATVETTGNGLPTGSFWANTMIPMINRTAYLYDQLLGAVNGVAVKLAATVNGSSGSRLVGGEDLTDPDQGTIFGAQSIFAQLLTMNAVKASLSGNNTWTGPSARSGTAATRADRVARVNPADGTAVIGASADVFIVDALSHSGGAIYTLKSTSPEPPLGAPCRVIATNMSSGKPLYVHREDASEVAAFTPGVDGTADFVYALSYNGLVKGWYYAGASGCAGAGSDPAPS